VNLPIEQASFLASIHGLFQIAGVWSFYRLRITRRRKTILFSNSVITALLISLMVIGKSWSPLCGITGALAVFYGATFPIYGACAGDYFPKEAMGTVAGAWTPFYGSGAILTHWVPASCAM